MTQSFITVFSVSLDNDEITQHGSENILLHGFLWDVLVDTKDSDFFDCYLCCENANGDSKNKWSCGTTFSLQSYESGGAEQLKTTSYVFNNEVQNWGWGKFMKKYERKIIKITACVTITSITLGTPSIEPITPDNISAVMFQRRLSIKNLDNNVSYTCHEANGKTWLAHIQKPEANKLKFKVECYDTQTGTLENLDKSVLIVMEESKNVRQTRGLGEFFNFNLKNNVGSTVKATFIIDYVLPLYSGPPGVDFGREYLSLPAHGNNSFLLKDNTSIPLSSYILARNSPVLKNLIEKEGELDHDVTDFEPEAVRIFADACYSGNLEKLSDSTEFKIFCDFVKMVSVFKVEWAKGGCLEFYRKHLPKPSEDFNSYWEYALLALDSVIKHTDVSLLDHLLSCIPENKLKFQFRLPQLIADTTKRAHLDLIMVVVVEFNLVEKFTEQILTVLMMNGRFPLLTYWLENFNFSLCDKDALPLLAEAVEQNGSADLSCELITLLKSESGKADDENKDENLIPEDGTLATLARNRWSKMKTSTWPCSKKRPFSIIRRSLQKGEHFTAKDNDAPTMGC
eukprot:sb/3463479/